MAVTVKVVDRPAGLARQTFLPAIAEGLGVTFRHFIKNWFGNTIGRRNRTEIQTIEYPEQRKKYPPRNRGLHRLMKRANGEVRCVACMMCPTVCPAHCITIVPEDAPDARIEKRPAVFEIDELRCVVCGFCVEACPCDAIRMDTGMHAWPSYKRDGGLVDMPEMLSRAAESIAVQGGVGAFWREKVKQQPQTPVDGAVSPPGAPLGPVPSSEPGSRR